MKPLFFFIYSYLLKLHNRLSWLLAVQEIPTEQNNSLLTELLALTAGLNLHARSFLPPLFFNETSYCREYTSAKVSHEQTNKQNKTKKKHLHKLLATQILFQ